MKKLLLLFVCARVFAGHSTLDVKIPRPQGSPAPSASASPVPPSKAFRDRVTPLINQLSAKTYPEREAAEKALGEFAQSQPDALYQILKEKKKNADAEGGFRIGQLVRRYPRLLGPDGLFKMKCSSGDRSLGDFEVSILKVLDEPPRYSVVLDVKKAKNEGDIVSITFFNGDADNPAWREIGNQKVLQTGSRLNLGLIEESELVKYTDLHIEPADSAPFLLRNPQDKNVCSWAD